MQTQIVYGSASGRRTVPSYPTQVPGLVIHRDFEFEKLLRGSWAVTHEPSGLRIAGNFQNRQRALAFATAIAGLADWTEDAKKLAMNRELSHNVRKVIWS